MLIPQIIPLYVVLSKYFPNLVKWIVTIITGFTKRQNFDLSRLPVLMSSEAGGTSIQNMLHWIQRMRDGENRFRKFDFGSAGNIHYYHQLIPPEYNIKSLKKLVFPIYVFAGSKDAIISAQDFEGLIKLLPNKARHEYIDDYGHLDYIWSNDAHVKLYPKLLSFLKE